MILYVAEMAKINFRLHRAAYHGDIDTLRALLKDGEEANSRNRKGNTPLVSALIGVGKRKTKEAIVDLLIDHGADTNLVNNEGDTILHVLVKATFHKKIPSKMVEKLIIYGANRTLVNKQDLTACQLAFQVNNSKLGTLLLFYEKPQYIMPDELPTYSKSPTNSGGNDSSYINTFTTSIQRKSPGLLSSLIKFITSPFSSTVYEIDSMNKNNKNNKNNNGNGKNPRRYYDDITISEVQFTDPSDPLVKTTLKNLDDILEEENRKSNEMLDDLMIPLGDLPSYSNA